MLAALRIHRLAKRLEAGNPSCHAKVDVLCEVELRVGFGEVVAVTGPAGSGKTTLLQCAAGLLEPTSGSVFRAGPVVYGAAFNDFPPSNDPRRLATLLVWDDPFGDSGPSECMELKQWLRRMREAGNAVLISGRSREKAELCGARAVALDGGRLVELPEDQEAPRRRARIAERTMLPRNY